MSRARAFASFLWAFFVGDDWRLSFGLLLALASTALVRDAGVPAWWLVPSAVAFLLTRSLRRAIRAGS